VVGLFDPASRVNSVSFYHDVNLNRRLDTGIDVLMGVDTSSADGWGITIPTAPLGLGEHQFLAQATYDGSASSLVVSAATFVREPFGAPVTYQSTDVPKQIRDLKKIESTLSVPDTFTIADVDITLTIAHSAPWDLDVYLIHPDGTRVELFTDVAGYLNGGGFAGTTLDDDAPTVITSGQQPFTGRYRPEGSLSVLDGKSTRTSVSNVWKLEITDDSKNGYGGQLNAWAVTITPSSASAAGAAMVVDANFAVGEDDYTTSIEAFDFASNRERISNRRMLASPEFSAAAVLPAAAALEEYVAKRLTVIDANGKRGRPQPSLTFGLDSPLVELLAMDRLAL
jgi:subtilisin-like proprotein convertase family protein